MINPYELMAFWVEFPSLPAESSEPGQRIPLLFTAFWGFPNRRKRLAKLHRDLLQLPCVEVYPSGEPQTQKIHRKRARISRKNMGGDGKITRKLREFLSPLFFV